MFIPIAAREGDNIAARSPNMPWWTGPTVVEALDEFQVADRPRTSRCAFPIQDVYRFDERRILAGRVESGRSRWATGWSFRPEQQDQHGQNHRALERPPAR